MKLCWICGNIADSEEHKFKASDIKKAYGKKFDGYYVGENAIPIKSFKSKEVKFPKVICINCNVKLTRPHDDSYDKFINYFYENFESLLKSQKIDFKLIYGSSWKEEKLNLYKYFVKHAGCKIVTAEYQNDVSNLANFILGKSDLYDLVLKFELKHMLKLVYDAYNRSHKYAHLFNSNTVYFGDRSNLNFGGWLSNNWLTTNWAFSRSINPNKMTDFYSDIEKLQVINLDFYDDLGQFNEYDKMITYTDYGEKNSLQKRIEHFQEMIE